MWPVKKMEELAHSQAAQMPQSRDDSMLLGGDSIDILGTKLGTKLGTILGRAPLYRAQFRAQNVN